ncbi:polysaccharide deacetylase [Echinicola pacifica]|uniref:Polysaccharide deacetylase n=1 Tax=Echinicola pacifica TaxID=346377 RepID=A0A918QDC1_9BACT|nr:polysaccharide deacetylase family protein [Echinicola pacifica]GGZ40541.1 polysaccharide deacetylase [Echinicola pacifica]
MLIHYVPSFIQRFFPHYIWHKSRQEKEIYLTFDDGPVPGVTDYILDELELRGMKANFFMVGDNVRKHPALAREVVMRGHQVGNHTYHHLNGRRTADTLYFEDIVNCAQEIQYATGEEVKLFRPPYGQIKSSQGRILREDYSIIMWDVLSGDYSPALSADRCLKKTQQYSRKGSIIVFHDQQKTMKKIPQLLPCYLDFVLAQGYRTSLL